MDLQSVARECDRYHEKLFSWLIYHVFELRVKSEQWETLQDNEGVIEFCESLEKVENLNRLIKAVACSSPGRFGEVYFRNRPEFTVYPKAKNEPRRYYKEQWEALEYKGDLLICAGAGTGKTWVLANKGLFIVAFDRASVLVVTNTDNARSQIFSEMEYQIKRSAFLSEVFPEEGIKRGNPKEIRPSNPDYGKIQFCLAGDGEQVLGIQIGRGGYLILDEAARYKSKAWAKILSRARRGCRVIAGSVPYGEKGNRFEKLLRSATDLSVMKLTTVRGLSEDVDKKQTISFAKVKWNRELQPGWNKEEEAMAIEFHGSKNGYEYGTYVRGDIMDPEGQVFLDEYIRATFVRIPLYKKLMIVWDAIKNIVTCSVSIEDALTSRMIETKVDQFACPGDYDNAADLPKFNITRWVTDNLPYVPVDVGGLDSGKVQDISVLLGVEDTGHGFRCRWSVVSLLLPYPMWTELIAGIYKYKKRNLFNLGMGIEASSQNIATSIWEGCRFLGVPANWLSPISWQTKVVLMKEDGSVEWDKFNHEVTRPAKHHLTVRMTDLMISQSKGKLGSFELPECDGAMKTEFSEHTKEYTPGGIRYGEEDDHYIEAARVALGRLLEFHGGVELTRASKEAVERITLPREKRDKRA